MVRCDHCGEECGEMGVLVKLAEEKRLILCDRCWEFINEVKWGKVEYAWGYDKEIPPGTLNLARAKFLVRKDTEVEETGYEIAYMDAGFKIVAIDTRASHLAITVERKVG